ncbi:radical SAM protein [Pseudoalteromonas fenneropenaei]|uniref:Radical SAM protein n=1 Tax=Pseudoalteromonas fenneropenaei TaxID=1737459 RepID=A0ABV7CJT5_9GAMM
MRPATEQKITKQEFVRLRQRAANQARLRRLNDSAASVTLAVPEQIGIKMNNTCNLRCQHCFEWNEEGYHHHMEKQQVRDEVELALIEKLLKQTESMQSAFYLWGGEPLMYTQMAELADLFERYPRWVTICTNGMLIKKHLPHLLKMSANLAMLVSLDGLAPENDAIRGAGVFDKVVRGISTLLRLRQQGKYQGKVSICLTLHDGVIGKLTEFLTFFAQLGIDSVYIVFPWYMPESVAADMDEWVQTNLPYRAKYIPDFSKASWHGYTHHINAEKIPELLEELRTITAQTWPCRVRFHPDLSFEEVTGFVKGETLAAEGKTRCTAINHRLDVLPGGSVSSCKFFPELEVGNLQALPLKDIWHGQAFNAFRSKVQCGLMPVCSKCTLLYSTG